MAMTMVNLMVRDLENLRVYDLKLFIFVKSKVNIFVCWLNKESSLDVEEMFRISFGFSFLENTFLTSQEAGRSFV